MEILLAVLGIGLIWFIYYYNKIKKYSIAVEEASSGIDVALSKRFSLIPNLVETVKAYTKHEKEVFEIVAKSRSEMMTRVNYENQMNETITKLLALSEAYPELKASENFLHLQRSLADTEEHLQAARRLYNRNVANLNETIAVFPGSLVNGLAHEKRAPFYEAETEERRTPSVDFKN